MCKYCGASYKQSIQQYDHGGEHVASVLIILGGENRSECPARILRIMKKLLLPVIPHTIYTGVFIVGISRHNILRFRRILMYRTYIYCYASVYSGQVSG